MSITSLILYAPQINEENGTPRPVMRIAKPSPDKAPKSRLLAEFLNPPTTASGEGM